MSNATMQASIHLEGHDIYTKVEDLTVHGKAGDETRQTITFHLGTGLLHHIGAFITRKQAVDELCLDQDT